MAPATASSTIRSPERARDGGDGADRRRRLGRTSWRSGTCWGGLVRRRRGALLPRQLPELRRASVRRFWTRSRGKKRWVSAVSKGEEGTGQRSERGAAARHSRVVAYLGLSSTGTSSCELAAAALPFWWCTGEWRVWWSKGEAVGCGEMRGAGSSLNRRDGGARWSRSRGIQRAGEAGARCLGGPGVG